MEPVLAQSPEVGLATLVHDLKRHGYAVSDTALPESIASNLFQAASALDANEYSTAGIGREQDHEVNQFVRGDRIRWVGRHDDRLAAYLEWMERLRLAINRELFLGLFEYECHFARYPVGRFYRTHLDAFRGEANRVLSTVLYLNPQWGPEDGGELVLYEPDWKTELTRITPALGRIVVFLSEEFPHEVLPTRRARHSLTGWFRVNQSSAAKVDPGR
ncbi:MAG: 2OG-Fe(II) oxygenase [Xanthomonadales bacterium]|nr:2OG-Fe(II) oxygenase [Xanthomonadales bacterium]